jgi:hypothetical protein
MDDNDLKLPQDVADEVRRYIDGVRYDWAGHPMGVDEIASKLSLLPLSLDMGGFAAMKADGSFVTIAWDHPMTERPIVSARVRDISLSVGSQRYPALARLLPKREPGSEVCSVCGGTGKHPLVEQAGIDNIVCSCGGLGWLPSYWEPV